MSTQDRRISIYPSPSLHQLLVGFAKDNEQSKSKLPVRLVEDFFAQMPDAEKQRLRQLFRNMNEEERERYFRRPPRVARRKSMEL